MSADSKANNIITTQTHTHTHTQRSICSVASYWQAVPSYRWIRYMRWPFPWKIEKSQRIAKWLGKSHGKLESYHCSCSEHCYAKSRMIKLRNFLSSMTTWNNQLLYWQTVAGKVGNLISSVDCHLVTDILLMLITCCEMECVRRSITRILRRI